MKPNTSDAQQLIYFQNLIPGTQNSPFIDRYKEACLADEADTSERRSFINYFPPVLSFYEKQKKEFYDKEAKSCSQFCCGGMGLSYSIGGEPHLQTKDHYMFSFGSGTLYEGNASSIKGQIQQDIKKTSFGSQEQNDLIDGLKQFNSSIEERTQKESMESANQNNMTDSKNNSINPLNTTLTPPKG